VHDIEAVVKGLLFSGVKFEYYPQFMKQDELGNWTAPGGTRVAWFNDPDGNTSACHNTDPSTNRSTPNFSGTWKFGSGVWVGCQAE